MPRQTRETFNPVAPRRTYSIRILPILVAAPAYDRRTARHPLTYEIRPGVPEDVEAREHVRVTTWKAAYCGIMPDEYLDALKVEPEAVAGQRSRPRTHDGRG